MALKMKRGENWGLLKADVMCESRGSAGALLTDVGNSWKITSPVARSDFWSVLSPLAFVQS